MENKTLKIITIENKTEEKILRKKTAPFDFSKFSKKEIHDLIKKMREAMKAHQGIGLSANQIGLNMQLFIAQIPKKTENQDFYSSSSPDEQKFYAIFNPQITKVSKEKTTMEEGCLSVSGIYGDVQRPAKIVLSGFDKNGKRIKIKAWGVLARVFQHEVDHLNGALFIDRTKNLYQIEGNTKKEL